MKKSYAIILAAGNGTRMGGAVAKQYQLLGGKPVLYYSVRAFEESAVDGIVLVTAAGMEEYAANEIVGRYGFRKVMAVTAGGEQRADSVLEGLRRMPEDGIVLIHDGARPFVTPDLIHRLLARMEEETACIPAVPLKDTVKRAEGGVVTDTPDRSRLFSVQTPQAFEVGLLRRAFQKYGERKQQHPGERQEITDDAMLVEKMLGGRVVLEEGDYRNIKLTTPEDRFFAEALLADFAAGDADALKGKKLKGAAEETKPEYLYHGSPYLFEKLVPQPAAGACGKDSMTAIYAAATMREVIPFALPIRWYPDGPEGRREFRSSGGRTELIYGTLNPEGRGYVYKMRSDSFTKVDEWQWVSETEVVPEEIAEIEVKDYWDTVSFSDESREIQEKVWGGSRERSV